jgi:hypothetical protein
MIPRIYSFNGPFVRNFTEEATQTVSHLKKVWCEIAAMIMENKRAYGIIS